MPEPAQGEHHDQVQVRARASDPISTERNEEVIAKPGGQGDVPSLPELGKGFGDVRVIEILGEVEPEHAAHADGHIRIAGKVIVQLQGEKDAGGPGEGGGNLVVGQCEDQVRGPCHHIGKEHLLAESNHELPYSVGVFIEQFEETKKLTSILATILVEKDSQKGIIIGKKGSRLKEVGQLAREEMEQLFAMKIYLEMWVKVQAGWRDNPRILTDLGYGMGEMHRQE